MAKDDYDVIVFKILTYLYAVMKGRISFIPNEYHHAIGSKDINNDYLIRIYKMMSDEGLVEKLNFTKPWEGTLIPLFNECNITITAKGIHYLEENDKMKTAGKYLKEKADTIINLAIAIGLEHIFNN